MAAKKYPWHVVALGIAIPCVLFFLLIMGGFEIFLRSQETVTPSPNLITQKSNNSVLVYELRPHASEPGFLVQSNAQGFRDDRDLLPDHDGSTRVVVLGDSATLQSYIPANETWVALLERRMDKTAPTEVINTGVNGYDTIQEAEVLRAKAMALNPDVVLIAYTLNDPVPSAGPLRDKYVAEDNIWCQVHTLGFAVPCVVKNFVFVQLRSVRWLVHQYDALRASYVDFYIESHKEDSFKSVVGAFATINQTIHNGTTVPKVCVVIFPVLRYDDGYAYAEIDLQVRALANSYGWPALALSEKIIDENALCLRQSPNDELHPNVQGDVSIALALEPFLRTQCLSS